MHARTKLLNGRIEHHWIRTIVSMKWRKPVCLVLPLLSVTPSFTGYSFACKITWPRSIFSACRGWRVIIPNTSHGYARDASAYRYRCSSKFVVRTVKLSSFLAVHTRSGRHLLWRDSFPRQHSGRPAAYQNHNEQTTRKLLVYRTLCFHHTHTVFK